MRSSPELIAKYPLKLKWRQSVEMVKGEHFSANDPEVSGRIEVAYVSAARNWRNDIAGWRWNCSAPAIHDIEVIKSIPVSHGVCETPREAAWAAEQCYERYLEIVDPETHRRSRDYADRRDLAREEFYARHSKR